MILKGKFQNGVVVLDGDASGLREGQWCTVRPDETDSTVHAGNDAAELKSLLREANAKMDDDWRRSMAEVDAHSWDDVDDEEAARRRVAAGIGGGS